jgi:hypothetical protein
MASEVVAMAEVDSVVAAWAEVGFAVVVTAAVHFVVAVTVAAQFAAAAAMAEGSAVAMVEASAGDSAGTGDMAGLDVVSVAVTDSFSDLASGTRPGIGPVTPMIRIITDIPTTMDIPDTPDTMDTPRLATDHMLLIRLLLRWTAV